MKNAKDEMITKEILGLLEESFEKVQGVYLDRGTSFFETLAAIDDKQASKTWPQFEETIAGHVNHVIFYIAVLEEYITGARKGKTDWAESWKVRKVDAAAWQVLKRRLEDEYAKLVLFVASVEDWEAEDHLGGVLGILAHCSYHLGAIRQLVNF